MDEYNKENSTTVKPYFSKNKVCSLNCDETDDLFIGCPLCTNSFIHKKCWLADKAADEFKSISGSKFGKKEYPYLVCWDCLMKTYFCKIRHSCYNIGHIHLTKLEA